MTAYTSETFYVLRFGGPVEWEEVTVSYVDGRPAVRSAILHLSDEMREALTIRDGARIPAVNEADGREWASTVMILCGSVAAWILLCAAIALLIEVTR